MAQLREVNTTDVREAIRLSCQTMARVFNADDPLGAPFFTSLVRPEAHLAFHPVFSDAHVPGRHLNALLNAQDAAGVGIDERALEQHARVALFSYSGPVPLPLNRAEIGGEPVNFTPHNVREGFHALAALARYRDSAEAREQAEASIEAILTLWNPERGWDVERLESAGVVYQATSTFIEGLARSIGPLVKYYRATGYSPALELAMVLKDKCLDGYFVDDGRYDQEVLGAHTHSTTCTMSSLAQLADATHDARLMARVKAFYDNGLWAIRDALGWVIESSRESADPDRGECNNTGDIVETALILGRWGHGECYADAERIVRGHLLPAQLRDSSFIASPPNPLDEDGKHDVADRHRGAFGFPAPYGHEPLGATAVSFNMDIVGGAVGSLCEVLRETVCSGAATQRVAMFFDHETDAVEVRSPYTHQSLVVRLKRPGPLSVRVPDWVAPDDTVVLGVPDRPRVSGGYLFLAQPPVDVELTFEFPLSERDFVLEHRARRIRARLHGDQVMAMENFGADLTYFEPLT